MPKYTQNLEDSFEPIKLKVWPREEEINRNNEILKCIDIKIAEVLTEICDNLKAFRRIGVDEETLNMLKIIKSNLVELTGIIKDVEIKLHDASRLADKTGHFSSALRCLLKKNVDTIESGASQVERFRDYTNLLLSDEEYLKQELETSPDSIKKEREH